ncbi:hypothetical protein AB6A40_009585 [Gnathostoma spinigerum]|uniref:Piwi domain-containing protein n=1 Tax=Gnathostoma spinigerum TaxID=75299 RepID=A0ABD6EU71_9BILA
MPFEELSNYMKKLQTGSEAPSAEGANDIFVMYIDGKEQTHDDLKLYEAMYQIPTQHIKLERASEAPNKKQTLENILCKMNCKNFGQNYIVVPESFAQNKWLSSNETLVIGYDVCHPDPQSSRERRLRIPPQQPSVIGISFNGARNPETFIGDYAYHDPRKEQVTFNILDERARWILRLFHQNRKKLPKYVIITRDGVSEGQFRMVMLEEVEVIRSAMKEFAGVIIGEPDYNPKFCVIVTTKRHHKRFVVGDEGKEQNCPPLTVIDKEVTRTDVTEVFMQPHRVIQGTGKLPAYTMLINEMGMNMEELQSLMLALCYTHQIVNSAISIPEPIYQADEWAKRGRNNFRAWKRSRDVPLRNDGSYDWDALTGCLCYMNRPLEQTRANA